MSAAIVGVLLAGGMARRMGGGDKCLIELDGRPLLAHAIDRLGPQVGAMVLSANGPPARFAAFGLAVVADGPGENGPLAGLLAGFRWAHANRPRATHVVSIATDTPFFPRDLVARLAAAAGAGGVAFPRSGGRDHNAFCLIPVARMAALARFLSHAASPRAADWLAAVGAVGADFDGPGEGGYDPFFNLNTPEDVAAATNGRPP